MLTLKYLIGTIALPAALLCLGAADAANGDQTAGLQSQPSHGAQMQCRLYFGCVPAKLLASRHPLSNGLE